jgi:hypothetical protein
MRIKKESNVLGYLIVRNNFFNFPRFGLKLGWNKEVSLNP